MDKFYLIDYQSIEAFSSNPPLTARRVFISLQVPLNRCSATVYLFYRVLHIQLKFIRVPNQTLWNISKIRKTQTRKIQSNYIARSVAFLTFAVPCNINSPHFLLVLTIEIHLVTVFVLLLIYKNYVTTYLR